MTKRLPDNYRCSRDEAWAVTSGIVFIVAILFLLTQIPAILRHTEKVAQERTDFAVQCGESGGAISREDGVLLCVATDGRTIARF